MHAVKHFRDTFHAALFAVAVLVLGACGQGGGDSAPPATSGTVVMVESK